MEIYNKEKYLKQNEQKRSKSQENVGLKFEDKMFDIVWIGKYFMFMILKALLELESWLL